MANASLAHLLGFDTPEQLVSALNAQTHQLYVDPERRAEYVSILERDGVAENFESQVYRRDGSRIWILSTARTVRDGAGTVLYVEGNVQDITARKEMEEAYQRLSLESMQSVVIIQNRHPVFVNAQMSDAVGYATAELMEFGIAQLYALVHPDDRDPLAARARDILNGRLVPSHDVFQFRRKDGEWRWADAQINRIEFHGQAALLMAVVDITERKIAQDKMQENVQRAQLRQELGAALARGGNDLRAVLDNLTRVVVGDLGDISVVNLLSENRAWLEPAAIAHVNPNRLAAVNEIYQSLRLPSDHPLIHPALAEGKSLVFAAGQLHGEDKTPDEDAADYLRRFGIHSYLVVPLQNNGRVLGLVGVAREKAEPLYTLQDQILLQEVADRAALVITNAQLVQQMQTELQARTRAEERYRTLVEQIPAITYITSAAPSGDTLFVSVQIQEILGYAPEEWLAQPDFWEQRLHPDDHDWVMRHAHEARADESPFHAEYRILARDGEVRWVRDQARFVYDTDRRALYMHGIMMDITTYKRLEQEYFFFMTQASSAQSFIAPNRPARPSDYSELGLVTLDTTLAGAAVGRATVREPASTTAQQQAAFADALRDAAAFLNRANDTDIVWEGILDTVARIVPYDTATIFRRQGAQLYVVNGRGFEERGLGDWIRTVTFSDDNPKFRMLTRQTQAVVLPDTRTAETWIEIPETIWIRSHIAAPLRVGDETIGMLCLDSAVPNFYTAEQGARLMTFADLAAAALRHTRLLRETEQRAEQLALLYDVGLTLNRVLDSRTQLDFLFKIAQRALRADRIAFFLYDAQAEELRFDEGIGMPDELKELFRKRGFKVNPPEGLVGWVAQQRLPMFVPDVSVSPHWLSVENKVKSGVAVPVEHEDELRGVLFAASYQVNGFTAQDERMLILFANQVAAAIELTRLFQAQAARQHELEILREASLAFASAPDRETLTRLILQFVLRLVTAQNAFLFFYQHGVLEFGGTHWSKNSKVRPANFAPRQDGLTYNVARTGKMILVENVNVDPLFSNWQWGGAIVGLALKGGGQVRAVLNVAHELPHRFTQEERRALELYAEQAAAALENARQYEEAQRQLRDAQLLHQAGAALNRTLSFQAALEQLAEYFMQAVGVEACCISTVDAATDEVRVMVDRDPDPATRLPSGTLGKLSNQPYLVQLMSEQRTLTYHRDMPNLEPRLLKSMEQYHWYSLLALPLFAGDQVIGVVELADQNEARVFSPEVVRLAESLAHQAASALQNARLFEETRQRAEHLSVLNRLARRVGGAATLDEMLEIIESETVTIVPADAFFIALFDSATELVDFVRVTDYGVRQPSFQWQLGPSLTRQVITSAHALRLDDRQEYSSLDNPPQTYGDGTTLRAWLGVPIRFGDEVLGVISLQSKRRAAFSEADEQLLQTIADQVASAISRVPYSI